MQSHASYSLHRMRDCNAINEASFLWGDKRGSHHLTCLKILTGATIMKPNNISFFFFFWSDIKRNVKSCRIWIVLGEVFSCSHEKKWPLNDSVDSMYWKLQAAYLRLKLHFTSSYFFIIFLLATFFFSGYMHYLPLCEFLEYNWIATNKPQELSTNKLSIRTVEATYSLTYLIIICDERNTNIIPSSPWLLRLPDQITRTWAYTSSCTPDLQQI